MNHRNANHVLLCALNWEINAHFYTPLCFSQLSWDLTFLVEKCERSELHIQKNIFSWKFKWVFFREFEIYRHSVLFWFANYTPFNSWLLPKLASFCKQKSKHGQNYWKSFLSKFQMQFSTLSRATMSRPIFSFDTWMMSTKPAFFFIELWAAFPH